MTLEVQRFLRSNNDGIKQLETQYGIKAKRHKQYPELVGLYYHQFASPMHQRIVQECRGLILNSDKDWDIAAFPFTKFFNHGEPNAHALDWNTARFYDKIDGSLIVMYKYAGTWQVATSGTPDASGEVHNTNITFAQFFWDAWKDLHYSAPQDIDATLMFELTAPENQIVVRHSAANITLLAARANGTWQECNIERFRHNTNWNIAQSHALTLENALDVAKTMQGDTNEGFVAVDAQFNRVKIKAPDYLRLHRLADHKMSAKRMLDIVRSGEATETLTYFPQHQALYDDVSQRLKQFIEECMSAYESISHIEDKREYAMQALQHKYPDVLFKMKRSGALIDMMGYVASMPLDKLAQVVL